jgi:hypothetical protein
MHTNMTILDGVLTIVLGVMGIVIWEVWRRWWPRATTVVGIAFQKPGTLPDQKARKASGASYGVHERSGPVHWAVEPLFSVSNRGGRTFRRGYCRHDSGVALSGDGTVVHITRSLPSSSACRLLRLVLPIMRSFYARVHPFSSTSVSYTWDDRFYLGVRFPRYLLVKVETMVRP